VLKFRLLGPLEVDRGGVAVTPTGQKQRALLALLLLNGGHVVSTDAIIDALWGAEPPRTAATSLQNLVSQLRKLVGSDALTMEPPGYVLRVPPEQVDVTRFRALVEDARTLAPAEAAARLREALALWRGSPLPELAYEPWAQADIGQLEELRLTALEQCVDAELEVGRHADLVPELEARVREQPLRERLRAQLMLALYRCGRQAEALQVYQDARRTLVAELGIEPSPVLHELHAKILRQASGLALRAPAVAAEDHFADVLKECLAGRLVPVLGADVAALAAQLAEHFQYPEAVDRQLTRVSQYVAVMRGSGPLYDELHTLLAVPAVPTAVHRLLAALPPLLRDRGVPHQLIVTTSYDHALEQAFLDAGEGFDVVSYIAAGRHRGKFCHLAPDRSGALIEVANTYAEELSLERRTVMLKLHGQVDPDAEREWESFVVTEDDYIDYLAQTEISNVVPVTLAAKLRRSHFLFLGYTMADWNLRVILNRLWGDNPLSYRSWAVQPEPKPLEREFWRRRDVDVLEQPLDEYAEALARYAGLESATIG
jgi:DNA-binding SARP family transcriptional activator